MKDKDYCAKKLSGGVGDNVCHRLVGVEQEEAGIKRINT